MPQNTQEFVDFDIEYDYEGTKEFGGGDFPLLPAAEGYLFDVANISQDTNKNNKAYVKVELVVADEQEIEELSAYAGQKTWANYYLSEKAIGRLKNFQIACGAPPGPFKASACMGARFRADIVHTQGSAEPGPDGQPREARTFANVANERPLTEATTAEEAPPPAPPVTKAKTTAPAAAAKTGAKNGAVTTARRA